MADVRPVGSVGEEAALRVYERRGYVLVARNWRCGIGELDLVVARRGTMVVCEVKTRRGTGFGGGHEAVTGRKQAKVRAVAEAFLQTTRSRPESVRFDVASVLVRSGGALAVELFEDAF